MVSPARPGTMSPSYGKAFTMNIVRCACIGMLMVPMMTGGAYAQTPRQTSPFSNLTIGVAPAQQMRPLATIGNVALGIWTRVPPPYDVAANRNLAANPLP